MDFDLPDTDSEPLDTCIEVLDVDRREWRRLPTTGSVPLLGTGSAMCGVGENLYLFGGYNEENFSADVFVLNARTRTWELRETKSGGPVVKHRAGMVAHGGRLVVFGGVGKPFEHSEGGVAGAAYRANNNFSFAHGFGWNNELHEYDPDLGECTDIYL